MVAIRCGAPAMMSYPQQQGDGSWVVQFYIRSPEGSSLSWHAFDTLNPGDVNNYGCVVMREDGQVIFDAVGKSMRVVGTLSSSGSFGGSSLSLPNGRAYAVAFNAGAQIRQVGPSSSIILSNMVTVNDGSISMSGYQSANLGAAAAGTQTHPSYGIAIDVTNY
ncbi:hypothetical protein [Xanthomonas phage JGB6]|nr:hypothetical protein [Xanthomonas phage JGB6]